MTAYAGHVLRPGDRVMLIAHPGLVCFRPEYFVLRTYEVIHDNKVVVEKVVLGRSLGVGSAVTDIYGDAVLWDPKKLYRLDAAASVAA